MIRLYKTHRWVLDLRPVGRGRKFFASRDDARKERERVLKMQEKYGASSLELEPQELHDIMATREKLAEYGVTLSDALKFGLGYVERIRRCKLTVRQLANEVVEAKRRDGMSEDYVASLKLRLDHFCREFGDRLIAGITVEELDSWLRNLRNTEGQPLSPKSCPNYRTNIGVNLSWAKQRRMIAENPVEFTASIKGMELDSAPNLAQRQRVK